MPKAKYTSVKGLVQEKGTGLDFTDTTSSFVYRRQILTVSNDTSGSIHVDGTGSTRQMKEEESGALVLLNPGDTDDGDPRVADLIVFMPTASAGLNYEFAVIGQQNHTGSDIVFKTAAETSAFLGQKRTIVDGAGGIISGSQLTLVATGSLNKAHLLGSSFEVVCDGTDWYVVGGLSHGSENEVTAGSTNVSGSINRRK